MIEVTGNLWTYPADWHVITTNGFVKKNGECVMGRGCALEAKTKYPDLAKKLGHAIKIYGNRMWWFPEYMLATFPVKHQWFEKADLELIKDSVDTFLMNIKEFDKCEFVMPRPGCGNGQLKWEDVKPIVSKLPDNVKVITYANIQT